MAVWDLYNQYAIIGLVSARNVTNRARMSINNTGWFSMYNGLKVIDFHLHFPTQSGSIIEGGPDPRQQYVERVGERRAKVARELAMKLQPAVARNMGF